MKRLSSSSLKSGSINRSELSARISPGSCLHTGQLNSLDLPSPSSQTSLVYSSRSCVIFRHDHLLFPVCVPIEVSRLSALIQKSAEDRISFHTLEARKQTSAPPWCRFTVRYSHAQPITGDALILSFLWSIFIWAGC